MGFDSRANCALGLPRSRTSTGSSLCTASPSNPAYEATLMSPLVRCFGGDDGIRTHDPLLAGQVLSQLSYTPIGAHPLGSSLLRRSFQTVSLGNVGIDLFSRTVAGKVSLAQRSLTSVFGMGTGGPSAI